MERIRNKEEMNWPDDFINKIICGDCLEVMKEMSDKCVDLVLTDPPYGIGESNEKNASRGKLADPTNYGHYEWDSEKIDVGYFIEIKRISRNQVIFGGNYYGNILGDTSCYLVWDKMNYTSDFADCELAWTSFDSAVRIFRWQWMGMLQQDMSRKEIRTHPTQKPLALFTWILKKYTKESDLILDPFLGSGTTAEACKLLKRNFIGIEINPEYCKIAEERLAQGVL